MAPSSKRQKTAEDKEQETFRKRRRGLQKKTHELSRFTNTDSYLVMFREGRYYLYSSVNRDGWPPSQSDIDTNYPPSERKGPSDFQATPFPTRRKHVSSLRAKASPQRGEGSSKTLSPEADLDLWSIGGTGKPVDNTADKQRRQGVRTQHDPDRTMERSDCGSGAGIGVDSRGVMVAEPGKGDMHDGHKSYAGKPEHDQSRAIRRKFTIPKLPVFPQLFDPPPT